MYRITVSNQLRHYHFNLKGSPDALRELKAGLLGQGLEVIDAPAADFELLPLLLAPNGNDCREFPYDGRTPWLVWDRYRVPDILVSAHEHGALCVLPAELSAASLLPSLHNAAVLLASREVNASSSLALKRSFERGEQLHLESDRVVRINRGVVRCTSVHPDGSEVLIGFYGPGDVLLAHSPHEACHVEMRAHTLLAVTFEPWSLAVTRADFYERLKQRICQMEQWSSMQARPNAESRLLGILQVIAGKFSHQVDAGLVLDIKLTHEQLAGMTGTTRTTITRILGGLRKQGMLKTVATPIGERLMLVGESAGLCSGSGC